MLPFFAALRRVALAGGILVATTGAHATEMLDAKLGRMAYAALQADNELADLNLGVRALQGGTIVLWGPSPSVELTKKAEAILKKLPGVVAVKIECDRDAVIDPLVRRVEADLKGNNLAPPANEPKPALVTPPPLPAVTARQVTTVEKPRLDGLVKPPATLLEPTPVNTDHPAIERIRLSERRFARLVIEERDGRLVISGSAADPADAWALAKKIAPHAGEMNVVVGRLR